MGFGLCALGFLFLTADVFGLDALGYALIAYGFWRVGSELTNNKGYTVAAYAAAVAVLPALIGVYGIVAESASLPELPRFFSIVKGVLNGACLVAICFAYCGETAKIASNGGAKVFSLRAKVTMYLSVFFAVLTVVVGFTGTDGAMARVIIISKLLMPIINALTLVTCFTTITTEARKVYEDEIIEQETEKLVRKRLREKKGEKEDGDE